MALSAEMIGDRWTLLILREAFYGVVRYDDMLADLGAPRSMLTDRLAKLVERGLMIRHPYQEAGERIRHAYVLTEAGRALGHTMIALTQWGEAHIIGKAAPVRIVSKTTSRPVRVELIDEDGEPVALAEVRLKLADMD